VSEPLAQETPGRELYVRHARKDGSSVVLLRAIDQGVRCVVEVDVWPHYDGRPYAPEKAGPYAFPSPVEATRFVTDAVETLIALGCDVRAS
jgi:hypothetical protein